MMPAEHSTARELAAIRECRGRSAVCSPVRGRPCCPGARRARGGLRLRKGYFVSLARNLATAAVVAAAMFGAAAPGGDTAWFGAGFGREAAAATTITDQLTNRSSKATRRSGGTFTSEGWKVTDPAQGGKTGA